MPFKPGQSGNPSGVSHDRPILDAIRRAMVQEDAKRLREGVEKLWDAFAAGERWALEFVAEKIDGPMPKSIAVEQSGVITHEHVELSAVTRRLVEMFGGRAEQGESGTLPN